MLDLGKTTYHHMCFQFFILVHVSLLFCMTVVLMMGVEVVAIVDLTILHGGGRLVVGSKYGRGWRHGTMELLVVGSYVVFLPGEKHDVTPPFL